MNTTLTALIVDKNPTDGQRLTRQVQHLHPALQCVYSADPSQHALGLLTHIKPQLLFWDISHADLGTLASYTPSQECQSFDLVLTKRHATTLSEQYPFSILGYLDKPVEHSALSRILNHWEDRRKLDQLDVELRALSKKLQQHLCGALMVPTLSGFDMVAVDQIIYCESDNNYARIYLNDGSKILVSKTLKYLEQRLQMYAFVRVHKRYLIHLRYLKRYSKGDGGTVEMQNGQELSVARNRKETLISACLSPVDLQELSA